MKATVIKSGRLGAAVFLIGLVALIPIAIFVGVISALVSPLMAVVVSAALLAWMIWILYARAVSCNVSIADDGTVNLGIYFPFKTLTWTGTRQDIAAIMHITYDSGPAEAKVVLIKIKDVGAILMRGWNKRKASILANALGMEVQDTREQWEPIGLNRNELTKMLGKST
jgi:hypothetical protein